MMRYLTLLFLLSGSLVLLGTCARDVTGGITENPYPQEVVLSYRVKGVFDPAVWYYMVFNFSAAPSIDAATAPLDLISTENRGKNWELYVVYHRTAEGAEELYTLERPGVPTVLRTGKQPVDSAVADFDGDSDQDIAVACRGSDTIELIRARQIDIYKPVYYDDPVVINTGAAPLRIHAAKLNGDSASDIIAVFSGTSQPFIRVLLSDGAGGFAEQPIISLAATPVDSALADLDGDGKLDLAVLTTGASAAERVVQIFKGDGAGGFTPVPASPSAGDDPVGFAVGQLDIGGLDMVVADSGGSGNGQALVLLGAGDGTFTAGPALAVSGKLACVGIGKMFGQLEDVVVGYTDGTGTGQLGVFQNEAATPFVEPGVSTAVDAPPYHLQVLDTGKDSNGDVVFVDGAPGGGRQNLYIRRGLRTVPATIAEQPAFLWADSSIVYPTDREPSRITLADLRGTGTAKDFVVPNFSDTTDGNSIDLFFALGKENYTNANIYWTDQLPEFLTMQDWYVAHSIGPNSFELRLDPGLFWNMAQLPPDQKDGFLVDFMTGTSAITFSENIQQTGEIHDHLDHPIAVPMEIGRIDDNQNTPIANNPTANPNEDIDYWQLEVN